MSRIISLYRGLSRPLQWAAIGLLVLGAYFAVAEPAIIKTSQFNEKADELSQQLDTARARRDRSVQLSRAIKGGQERYGKVLPPGENPDERMQIFATMVGDVLKEHGIDEYRLETRPAVQISQGVLRQAFSRNGKSVMRAVSDCRFSASPETVSAVLSALEQSPAVGSVSNVQVRRSDALRGESQARELTVDLAIEAWVLDVDAGRRGGGA
ncbi:MAG: hypothetical protein H6815_13265 [Phycisphaeraceae bacterium]|nr:hypothetical protein [Phycisphaerales bacterium]MCB9861408.1 hypothetical protein [Phycisphaeraceae bacterium]